jgi:tetratricopeptide (TPR) repeat protein
VLGVQPHAHNLAKEVRGFATLPDGTTKSLIFIRDWDFRWQDTYRYSKPLSLPKGTILRMRYTYDNSTANPRNPNRPPKRVTYGQTTSSEMGSLWVQVVPHSESDLQVLDEQFAPKLLQDDIAGYEKMLEVSSHDASLHAALAYGYLEAGRVTEAIARFDEAASLDPTSARQYDLGSVLLQQQRFGEAAEHFAEAVRLKSDSAEALYALGVVRQQEGRLDEAIDAYRRALQFDLHYVNVYYNLGRALAAQGKPEAAISEFLRGMELSPNDAEAHRSIATILASTNQTAEAIAHYRRALQLAPNLPGALVDLAWILATSDRPELRDPSEAVRLAERVVELTKHQNASALDTLGVAYAAAGQIDRAIATAQAAFLLASESGDAAFASRIRQRLDYYSQHKP